MKNMLWLEHTIKTGPYAHITYREKFWSLVAQKGKQDCWKWKGKLYYNKYGCFSAGKQDFLAHRISYFLHYGVLPEGVVIRHRCDNPSCVNPYHLLMGTYSDNTQDMLQRGRSNPPRGTRARLNKLSEEDVLQIRSLYADKRFLQKELASRYGISSKQVSKIVNRKQWGWLK